jgi:hypothetical protein
LRVNILAAPVTNQGLAWIRPTHTPLLVSHFECSFVRT